MASCRGAISILVLLIIGAAAGQIPGSRSVLAQPHPPLPRTTSSLYHRVAGSWRATRVVRLGQEVRFELRVQKSSLSQSIYQAKLTLHQTILTQDGAYHIGAVLASALMKRTILANGDIRFRAEMRLQDHRMVGKVFAEFDVLYGEGEFEPSLMVTVKPVTGKSPGGNPYIDAFWGLRMTVALPRRSYPRDALVDATMRVRNVSHQNRTLQSGYCTKPPWVEVLNARGRVLPPPFFGGIPECGGMISTTIHPGGSIERHQYVVLAAGRIRVAATFGQFHLRGNPVVLHLTTGSAPAMTVQDTATGIGVQLRPAGPVSGPLHYGFEVDCHRSGPMMLESGSHGWLSTPATQLTAPRPANCDPAAPWAYHALAGWLGQPVAHIDVVSKKAVPCDRGTVGRQPTLAEVPLPTLDAIGISLLPPPSLAPICQASAIYTADLLLLSSVPPEAALAHIISGADPLVDGHLAWVVLIHSPDPNHPLNPPVLYLSFIDARSGALLDTVYAGGLHPPGPPIHMRTVPARDGDWVVLSGTQETPPISETQARKAMLSFTGGQEPTVREVVLARVYNPDTPPLRDHLCWIFSFIPRTYSGAIPPGGYWVVYVDAETGTTLMEGTNVPQPIGPLIALS